MAGANVESVQDNMEKENAEEVMRGKQGGLCMCVGGREKVETSSEGVVKCRNRWADREGVA